MLKIISLVGTIAIIILGILEVVGIAINPILLVICIITGFITFISIAFKWNIFCLKKYGLFSISGLRESFMIFKVPFQERNTNKLSFILVIIWLTYFICLIIFFQFAVIKSNKPDESLINPIFYFAFVPFSSFYFIFGETIKTITEKK